MISLIPDIKMIILGIYGVGPEGGAIEARCRRRDARIFEKRDVPGHLRLDLVAKGLTGVSTG